MENPLCLAPSEALAVVTIAILLDFTATSSFCTSVVNVTLVSKTFQPSRGCTVPANALIVVNAHTQAANVTRSMRILPSRPWTSLRTARDLGYTLSGPPETAHVLLPPSACSKLWFWPPPRRGNGLSFRCRQHWVLRNPRYGGSAD